MRKTSADATTGWIDLHREIDRSRRSGRNFALLRFSGASRRVYVVPSARRQTFLGRGGRALNPLVEVLRDSARSIDHVWGDRDDAYVVLCDTETRGVKAFLARIEAIAPRVVEEHVASSCIFPESGLTADALVSALSAPGARISSPSSVSGA
jgi:hypothetical protein